MSVSAALHRAIGAVRDAYGFDHPDWNAVIDTLATAYLDALEDERQDAA